MYYIMNAIIASYKRWRPANPLREKRVEMPQKSHRPRIMWRWLRVHCGDDERDCCCRWTLWSLPSFSCIYKTHAIAQRPAQMRMCSHDDNKEKNLRHPFWVEIPRFQHKKKKYNNNIILYIISLTRQKKKFNRKKGKKRVVRTLQQQQQLLHRVRFPLGPLNRYTPLIFDIILLLLLL